MTEPPEPPDTAKPVTPSSPPPPELRFTKPYFPAYVSVVSSLPGLEQFTADNLHRQPGRLPKRRRVRHQSNWINPVHHPNPLIRKRAHRKFHKPLPDTAEVRAYREYVTRFARLLNHSLTKHETRPGEYARHPAIPIRGHQSDLLIEMYVAGAAKFFRISTNHMSEVAIGKSSPGPKLAQHIADTCGIKLEQVTKLRQLRQPIDEQVHEARRYKHPNLAFPTIR